MKNHNECSLDSHRGTTNVVNAGRKRVHECKVTKTYSLTKVFGLKAASCGSSVNRVCCMKMFLDPRYLMTNDETYKKEKRILCNKYKAGKTRLRFSHTNDYRISLPKGILF